MEGVTSWPSPLLVETLETPTRCPLPCIFTTGIQGSRRKDCVAKYLFRAFSSSGAYLRLKHAFFCGVFERDR